MHTLCQVIPTKWRTYGDQNISPYVYERLVWISCKISSSSAHPQGDCCTIPRTLSGPPVPLLVNAFHISPAYVRSCGNRTDRPVDCCCLLRRFLLRLDSAAEYRNVRVCVSAILRVCPRAYLRNNTCNLSFCACGSVSEWVLWFV